DVAVAEGRRAEDVLAVERGSAKKATGTAAKHHPCRPARLTTQPVEKVVGAVLTSDPDISPVGHLYEIGRRSEIKVAFVRVALTRPDHPPDTSGVRVECKDAAVIGRQRLFLTIGCAKED